MAFHQSFAPFEHPSAVVIHELRAGTRRIPLREMPTTLRNDVPIALSCVEQGVTVVTDNAREFERIARVARIDGVAPWLAP